MTVKKCTYCNLPIDRGKIHPWCRREAEEKGCAVSKYLGCEPGKREEDEK